MSIPFIEYHCILRATDGEGKTEIVAENPRLPEPDDALAKMRELLKAGEKRPLTLQADACHYDPEDPLEDKKMKVLFTQFFIPAAHVRPADEVIKVLSETAKGHDLSLKQLMKRIEPTDGIISASDRAILIEESTKLNKLEKQIAALRSLAPEQMLYTRDENQRNADAWTISLSENTTIFHKETGDILATNLPIAARPSLMSADGTLGNVWARQIASQHVAFDKLK